MDKNYLKELQIRTSGALGKIEAQDTLCRNDKTALDQAIAERFAYIQSICEKAADAGRNFTRITTRLSHNGQPTLEGLNIVDREVCRKAMQAGFQVNLTREVVEGNANARVFEYTLSFSW